MSGLATGDTAIVLSVPKLAGKVKAPWTEGAHVTVEKVSPTGNVVVSGHGGYMSAARLERVER